MRFVLSLTSSEVSNGCGRLLLLSEESPTQAQRVAFDEGGMLQAVEGARIGDDADFTL